MKVHALPEEEVAAIKDTIESFTRCLEAGRFADWVRYWADDGVLMPPGHPRVMGHEALVAFMRENFGDVDSVTLSDWEVFGEGDLGVATTNVRWTTRDDSQPSDAMKQVIVLRKDAGGNWKLQTIMFNADA